MSKKKTKKTRTARKGEKLDKKLGIKHGQTITEKQADQLLDQYLRKLFMHSGIHRVVYRKHTKNAKVKCGECSEYFHKKEMEIDHIDPVHPVDGRTISFEEKKQRMLFCGLDNFQPVCKPCHNKKTAIENTLRRNNKKAMGVSTH